MPKTAKAVSWLTNTGRTTSGGRAFIVRVFETVAELTVSS
jgi:hypothetical protein